MLERTADFSFIVISPSGIPDAGLAIAASRAGAIGVVNLEFADDVAAALKALKRFSGLARASGGALVDGAAESLLSAILVQDLPRIDTIVLTASALGQLADSVEEIHARGKRAVLVVTSDSEAQAGVAAGCDALIAKGHEAGGWVGDETSFVLLQRLVTRCNLPIWVQGGVGPHVAAACFVAGAAGVVLDSQLLLLRESPLPDSVKARLATMDGSETLCLGSRVGGAFRFYYRPGLSAPEGLRGLEAQLIVADLPREEARLRWRQAIRGLVGSQDPDRFFLAVGQDAAFAARFVRQYGTVGRAIQALQEAVHEHVDAAKRLQPLAEGAPLAQSHGTRYSIVQGPMTRVSDRAEFAGLVAEGGALPFLALALMRAPDVEAMLQETRRRLGDRPWGVGVLGFVPADLRAEQLAVIRAYRPPYALIAGGRPDQARLLEAEGIPTYLHVPSPGLLHMFVQEGARRFVFEGRECGGHVGPRTSFVLWESMVDVLLDSLPSNADASAYHVLFAGGIHDGLSGAMVSALAAPLAERGVRIGVLIGTAYLFTEEAIRGGAITEGFQQAAVACTETVLLETGPGHATRCAPSPYVEDFESEKRRLLEQSLTPEDLRNRLEELNIGRLRIASKGRDRNPRFAEDPSAPRLIELDPDQQWKQGMYMIGQVAALHDSVHTVADLHHEVAGGAAAYLGDRNELPPVLDVPVPPPADVAIVGMACILPGAANLQEYWTNILNKMDAITEVPPERWDWRRYYDPDQSAQDKVYSRWGGFIAGVPFDPLDFGMPPSTLPSIEPFQLLTLSVVRAALQDAGFLDRPFPRERTSVILGAGGGAGDLSAGYMVRSSLFSLFGDSAPELTERFKGALPEWTEDSFAGLLMNVAAGRVANRFNLGGLNFTVDAACASSLAAVYLAVRDLENRTSDVVIAGGVDAIQNPFSFLCFSKTQALSPTGRCRTFDANSDGIAISEGFAVVVLKRLADTERDGDRVYAVIRGVGGSSDGRDRGLTAPRPEGQIRALRRAYAQANFSPSTVGLIEAHGTGTVAGDQAEIQALTKFFRESSAQRQNCAVGSVKSMIGHTKAAAGVAGLVKVSLALHHKMLPATLGVTEPNPKADFPSTAFYVNSENRPWIQPVDAPPRRAGVSAFGFGGTNFHVVVEEYVDSVVPNERAPVETWPAELLVWRSKSRQGILQAVTLLRNKIEAGARPRLVDLAYSVTSAATGDRGLPTLAIVATSLDDLKGKLDAAEKLLTSDAGRRHDHQGIHYAEKPLASEGKVAFLFPGQGSQYVNMLNDVAIAFPEARECFDQADQVLAGKFGQSLSRFVFPPPAFNDAERQQQQNALTETNVAQPALGAAGLALYHVLRRLGIEPDMAAGHSYGELVALCVAGAFDEATLFRLSEARGRFMREGAGDDAGTMAAVEAGRDDLAKLLGESDVTLANMNAPRQTVISGTRASVDAAINLLGQHRIRARLLPVACAFHSPLVAPAQQKLAKMLDDVALGTLTIPVFSNTTGERYPDDLAKAARILSGHLARPVEFVREIQAMYAEGARVFIEIGPRNVLSGLTSRILDKQAHVCVPLDQMGRPGLTQFVNGLATLASEGVSPLADELFRGRGARRLDLKLLEKETGAPTFSPTTWIVDGGRARPLNPLDPRNVQRPTLPVRVKIIDGEPSGEVGDRKVPSSPVDREAAVDDSLQSSHSTQPSHGGEGHSRSSPANVSSGPKRPHTVSAPAPATREISPIQTTSQVKVSAAMTSGPMISGPPGDRAGEVMQHFQQVMQRFLDTQRSVMLAYLQSPGAVARTSEIDVVAPIQPASSEENGFPIVAPSTPRPPVSSHSASAPTVRSTVPSPISSAPPSPRREASPYVDVTGGEANGTNRSPTNGKGHTTTAIAHETDSTDKGRVTAHPVSVGLPVAHQPTGAPPKTAASAAPGREQLSERLLALVSERTGYPTDMLGLDVDLEADLGIDSIKRVEIVGTFVRSLTLPPERQPEMERLTASRTLRQLLEQITEAVAPAGSEPMLGSGAKEGDQRPFDGGPSDSRIKRFVVEPVLLPAVVKNAQLARDGVVVITDDSRGIGVRVAKELRRAGYRTVRIVLPTAEVGAEDDTNVLRVDLGNPDVLGRLLGDVRVTHGRISALVHLAPLRGEAPSATADQTAWNRRLAVDLTALFQLAQGAQADLEASAKAGGAAVIAATMMGGTWASDADDGTFFPGHGSISGFLKTLGQEWPSVRVRAVDFAPSEISTIADAILAELFAAEDVIEVGYRQGQRFALDLVEKPLVPQSEALPLEGAVVLVTGGARGITALAAIELARFYRPTFVIVGRTSAPEISEPSETASLTDGAELKRAIVDRRRRLGQVLTPVAVEAEYQGILREREVRANLAALEQLGSRVIYRACDVRDANAFGQIIDEVYRAFGRIDGVLHGAGVIEDKLVRDKRLDSFERVMSTKINSAVVLANKLKPDQLKFLVFFSSFSGRFGNRGQGDYAAASEILNKLAVWLDRRWPARVVAIDWGPWLTTGMVSPEVQRQFQERGVDLIPPDVGCRMLLDEVRFGAKPTAEVVVGGLADRYLRGGGHGAEVQRDEARRQSEGFVRESRQRRVPLFSDEEAPVAQSEDDYEIQRVLDLHRDLYLADHRLDGRPVLPVAMALEFMAEAAVACWPALDVVAVHSLRLMQGVTVGADGFPLRLLIKRVRTSEGHGAVGRVVAEVKITSTAKIPRVHYQAMVELVPGDRALAVIGADAVPPGPSRPIDVPAFTVADAYRDYLFHGPMFQGILAIDGLGADGGRALLRRTLPCQVVSTATEEAWVIDPVLVDCALQLQLIWARVNWDVTSLPSSVRVWRRLGESAAMSPGSGDDKLVCEFYIRPDSMAPISRADYRFSDQQGRLVAVMEHVEMTGSRELNRVVSAQSLP